MPQQSVKVPRLAEYVLAYRLSLQIIMVIKHDHTGEARRQISPSSTLLTTYNVIISSVLPPPPGSETVGHDCTRYLCSPQLIQCFKLPFRSSTGTYARQSQSAIDSSRVMEKECYYSSNPSLQVHAACHPKSRAYDTHGREHNAKKYQHVPKNELTKSTGDIYRSVLPNPSKYHHLFAPPLPSPPLPPP